MPQQAYIDEPLTAPPRPTPGFVDEPLSRAAPSVWQRLNTPMVPQIAAAARAFADRATDPNLQAGQPSWLRKPVAMGQGFMAGALEGAGELASSFTSPLGLVLTAAGMTPATAITRTIQGGAGAGFAAEGLSRAVTGETTPERLSGVVAAATGALGVAGAISPERMALAFNRPAQAAKKAHQAAFQSHVDLAHAIPASASTPYTPEDLSAAKVFLNAEHAADPIRTVTDLVDRSDRAIGTIESHVATAIAEFPTARVMTAALAKVKAALATDVRSDALTKAAQALQTLPDLRRPTSLTRLEELRQKLNAENKAHLKQNQYDTATARQTDPGFRAREIAAGAIREAEYGYLAQRGVHGIADLRRTEGSLIKVRNAGQRQIFAGEKVVAGRAPSVWSDAGAALAEAGLIGAGGMVGGVPGAIAGGAFGRQVGRNIRGHRILRDELIERAFSHADPRRPVWPTIPPALPIAGLLGPGARPMGPAPDPSGPIPPTTMPPSYPVSERLALPPARMVYPAGPAPDTSYVRSVPAQYGERWTPPEAPMMPTPVPEAAPVEAPPPPAAVVPAVAPVVAPTRARVARPVKTAPVPAVAAPAPETVTPVKTPWYERESKEAIFSTMRQIDARVQSAGAEARRLEAPHGQIAVGGASFDAFLRSESQAEILRNVNKGMTPADAGLAAKQWARDAIDLHNAKRPTDINWKRWEGSADATIESTVRELYAAEKASTPAPASVQALPPATVTPVAATSRKAPVKTPAQAAAPVVAQIERVIDTQGAKSGAEIQRRVINALVKEIEPASTAAGFGDLAYTGDGKGGGIIHLNGEPAFKYDKKGRIETYYSAETMKLTDEGQRHLQVANDVRSADGYTYKEKGASAVTKIGNALATLNQAGQIRVQIPGDGTFTIPRNPATIRAVIARMQQAGPTVWRDLAGQKVIHVTPTPKD